VKNDCIEQAHLGDGKESTVRQFKEEALAVVGTFAAVLIGSLAFVTLMMPFVFPFVLVAAAVFAWRHNRRASGSPRSPAARPQRPAKPMSGRRSPSPLPA
jgi:hypothetical protein